MKFEFRVRTDFSNASEEKNQSDGLLGPHATSYRSRKRSFVKLALSGFLLAFLAAVVPESLAKYFGIPAIALIGTSLILFFTMPGVACPSCQKSAETFDKFCPVCGAAGLHVSKLWGTRCESCGKTLGTYKSRNYRIRFCTHCGVMLDRIGI
ncbi:MAG TPA: hypothetical protein VFO86_01300 [Terriglobia bacterium]|nr:hypothetical protein [Terriglobia bacterium]